MEVIKDLAWKAYHTGLPLKDGHYRLPTGILPKQEVPFAIRYELGDLTSKGGYFVTPMDRFFRKSMERFNMQFKNARVELPRSSNPPITLIMSGELSLYAKGENGNSLTYNRILTTDVRFHHFDDLETGELNLETVIERSKERPLGEELRFDFDKILELNLVVGLGKYFRDGSQSCHINLKLDNDKMNVRPPLLKFLLGSKPEKTISGESTEDLINKAEEVLGYFFI